jgi:thioredoxin-like negative regulator of GroEL
MMMKTITNLDEIQTIIDENSMVLTYFTTHGCNVCVDLFPKIENMMEEFPEIITVRGEVDAEPGIVGAHGVFVVPTIVLFVDGKETIRRSRTIGVEELRALIERYYRMVFLNEE